MNLLVGGTGFVGSHVVEYFFQQGEISKGTFRLGARLKTMDANGVQGVEADLLDHHTLHEAMEGVDAVFNMASPMPGSDAEFQKLNTEGVLNLLEVATEAKVKSFVQLSTLDVYGFGAGAVSLTTPQRPDDEYQRGKAEADRLVTEFSKRNSTPKVTILRAAKAIGSRDESLVVPILRMAKSGKVSVPAGPQMSYSHPRDIAQAMLKAATSATESGAVFLLKSFDASPEEVAKSVVSHAGLSADVRREGRFSSSRLPKYTASQLKAGLTVDAQKNWGTLGYSPAYTLASASEEIASWYKKEPWAAEES